jgi:hypothetical protein
MALQLTGPISASDINLELGKAATAAFSLGGPDERDLAGVSSGPIGFSDFYGRSLGITAIIQVRESNTNAGYWGYKSTGSPFGTLTPEVINGTALPTLYTYPVQGGYAILMQWVGLIEQDDFESITFNSTSTGELVRLTSEGTVYVFDSITQMSFDNPTLLWNTNTDTTIVFNKPKKSFVINAVFTADVSPFNSQQTGYSDPLFGDFNGAAHDYFVVGTDTFRVLNLITDSSSSTITLSLTRDNGAGEVLAQDFFSSLVVRPSSGFAPSFPLGDKVTLDTASATVFTVSNDKTYSWVWNYTEPFDVDRAIQFRLEK